MTISGAVRAYGLAPRKTLVLANLRGTGVAGAGNARGLLLSDNQGSVRVENCEWNGAGRDAAISHRDGCDGSSMDSCADVAFARSTLRGGRGVPGWLGYTSDIEPGEGGLGLGAATSTVAVHDTSFFGGNGQQGVQGSADGGWGNDACRLNQATLFASDCTFLGGNGGNGDMTNCGGYWFGGQAGVALDLQLPQNLARIQECDEAGGTPGCDVGGLCSLHCYPQAPDRSGATFVDLPAPARDLLSPVLVRESTSPQITFRGQPGDRVNLFITAETQHRFVPKWEGVRLVRPRPPHMMMIVGTIPPSGALVEGLALGDLGPGSQSATIYLQPLFFDSQGNGRLGGWSTMVVLDSAF